jgi:hypothetical protein
MQDAKHLQSKQRISKTIYLKKTLSKMYQNIWMNSKEIIIKKLTVSWINNFIR